MTDSPDTSISPDILKRLAENNDVLADVNRMADQLGSAIGGNFDFFVRAETGNPTAQKLAIMVNFLLESVRSAIHQREQMAETLRGQAFLRQLIDVSPELIYTKDLDGRFVLANQATAEFYGTTPDKLAGKVTADFNVTIDKDIDSLKKRIIATGQSETTEEQLVNAKGESRWYRSTRVPVRNESGVINQILCIAADITDYKNASEELNRLVNELQSALKFKDQFLATMSHELRTPLNAILGFTGIQLMTQGLPPTTTMMLERIDFNAKRLANLINDVLDISRINAGRIEILWKPVKLRELAKTWHVDYQQRMTAKGLTFTLDVDETLPETVESDPERLTQIANNLLTNALKFTEQGSITLSLKRSGDQWSLSVADTGIGIPESWQQTVFEEFRQVESGIQSKYGGTGLGLAIVQRLCILMNGQIRLVSAPGSGSTFTVTFPLTPKRGKAGATDAE